MQACEVHKDIRISFALARRRWWNVPAWLSLRRWLKKFELLGQALNGREKCLKAGAESVPTAQMTFWILLDPFGAEVGLHFGGDSFVGTACDP